jgi:hypothetical protein
MTTGTIKLNVLCMQVILKIREEPITCSKTSHQQNSLFQASLTAPVERYRCPLTVMGASAAWICAWMASWAAAILWSKKEATVALSTVEGKQSACVRGCPLTLVT